MNKSLVVVIVVAGLLSLFLFSPGESYASQQSFSDVQITNPTTLPYRGNLANLDGVAVEDGRYDFTFTLYAEDDKQAPPWSETKAIERPSGDQLGCLEGLPWGS